VDGRRGGAADGAGFTAVSPLDVEDGMVEDGMVAAGSLVVAGAEAAASVDMPVWAWDDPAHQSLLAFSFGEALA
jgi:hypothetical protein